MPKLLIGIPSPRDLPDFLEATAKLKYDKYWSKYRIEYPAFKAIRDFFLEHKEYTHLAILCDDLIVKQEQAEILLHEAVEGDLSAIGGICNVGRADFPEDNLNISLTHLTNPFRPERRYEFMTIREWEELKQTKWIVQTKFQGFPFTIIRRDIIERFPFKTDGFYNNKPERGCCTDSVFCWELANALVPMYCDLRVLMYHMPNSRYLTNSVGQKEPYEKLELSEDKVEEELETWL